MNRTMRQLILLTTLALLAAAAPALGSGLDVIRDCTDDEVMSKTYTQKEYRAALRELAGDADQYGNCRSVIQRAQAAAAAAAGKKGSGGSGGSSSGGGAGSGGAPAAGGPAGGAGAIGSAPAADQLQQATPAEREAVEEARTAPPAAVALEDRVVDTAKVGTAPGVSQSVDLPTPLVVMLALLLAGTLAVAGLRVRRLVNTRGA